MPLGQVPCTNHEFLVAYKCFSNSRKVLCNVSCRSRDLFKGINA
jgi:hypothetical protein